MVAGYRSRRHCDTECGRAPVGAEGKTRHDLGREVFEQRVWKWKEESGNTILRQLRLLGGSCDWTRERFTLDEGLVSGGTRSIRAPL